MHKRKSKRRSVLKSVYIDPTPFVPSSQSWALPTTSFTKGPRSRRRLGAKPNTGRDETERMHPLKLKSAGILEKQPDGSAKKDSSLRRKVGKARLHDWEACSKTLRKRLV